MTKLRFAIIDCMLDNETKRRIDTARDILVGKVPDPWWANHRSNRSPSP
jgi:hypothetical protein